MTSPQQSVTPTKDLIRVEKLVKHFPVLGGVLKRPVAWVKAVDGVSFTIKEGETLGLVGESGCGKTTVGQTMLRLLEPTGGKVCFEDTNIFDLKGEPLKMLRRNMQIVFQDPYASLDPRLPIGESIAEGLLIHGIGSPQDRFEAVLNVLAKVGMEDYHAMRYPHEFSGGQRQRIGIARALVMQPKFIVLDEPVSALDVSIQAQVLNILKDLQREFGLTYLFVAHNLAVVEHISDRVAVMYLGQIAELCSREDLFREPLHPYTQALMAAIPVANPRARRKRSVLQGDVPSPLNPPPGCRFHPRCPYAMKICAKIEPDLQEAKPGRLVHCWLYQDHPEKTSELLGNAVQRGQAA